MAISKDPLARLAEYAPISAQSEIAVQEAIRTVFEKLGPKAGAIRAALHGTWLHEPLHAIMTDVPTGSWTATVLFDALAIVFPNDKLDYAADATLILGLAGAVGASITGMNDWAEIKDKAPRRIGAVHAILNVGATALLAASGIARLRKSRTTGRSLAMLGYLLVSASAHLGGNLVYEHGVGVGDSDVFPAH